MESNFLNLIWKIQIITNKIQDIINKSNIRIFNCYCIWYVKYKWVVYWHCFKSIERREKPSPLDQWTRCAWTALGKSLKYKKTTRQTRCFLKYKRKQLVLFFYSRVLIMYIVLKVLLFIVVLAVYCFKDAKIKI